MPKPIDSETIDSETRVTLDDHIALRLWLRILTCSNLIENKVRTNLRIDFDSTLPRFDLLSQLDREPEGLTMGELSKRMMVSGGNVTGLVNQLTDSGWLTREPHPDSKRTFIARLTKKGRKEFLEMADEHEVWIKEIFGHMTVDEVDTLMQLLARVKGSKGLRIKDSV